MKKNANAFIYLLFLVTILSACKTSDSEKVMEDVNEATQKNKTLENATYIQSMLSNWADGAFISLGDGSYNWTHTEYLSSEKNYTQIAEIDGRQYQLIAIEDEGFVPQWEEIEPGTHQLSNQLAPLFENILEEKYFDDIQLNDEDGKHYIIALTDAYSENQLSESIQELEDIITELEETVDDINSIKALEIQIDRLKNTEFMNPEIELVINNEGYLIKYALRYDITATETESIKVSTEYEITEYNLEDVAGLLPEIQ